MKFARKILIAAAALFAASAPVLAADDPVKTAREAFAKAYTAMDYKGICAVLDRDASFRGSLHPDRWTHRADNIVKERWNIGEKCDCGANVGYCKHAGTATPKGGSGVKIFTVGESDMIMTPDPSKGLTSGIYAVDTGTFLMKAKSGVSAQDIANPYVIMWVNTADEGQAPVWKMMHIDMHPCGDKPGKCK